MPFIHVRSLPFEPAVDIADVVAKVSRDFADRTGVSLDHVTTTWILLAPGHYAAGGRTARLQPPDSHPVLVDLLTPDFHDAAAVERMLRVVVDSIADRVGVRQDNIFVCHRRASSGGVLDGGEVVRWSDR